MKNSNFKRLVSLLYMVPAVFISIAFLRCWSLYYNSDTALIGLMADSVIKDHESPLYVWGVGYMGILLEVYGTALVFKLFGMGPITLNVISTGVFLMFVFIFKKAVAVTNGDRFSTIATMLLGCMGPTIYGYWLRPIPNYVEVIFFGTLSTLAYLKIVQEFKAKQSWFALLGFSLGFGLYTNQQLIYFYAAIACHIFLIFWSIVDDLKIKSTVCIRRVYVVLWAVALAGLISYVSGVEHIGNVKWQAYSTLKLVGLIIFAITTMRWAYALRFRIWAYINLRRYKFLVMVAAWLVGYSPELYGRYILNISSTSRTGLGVSFMQLKQNFIWILQAYAKYFGVSNGPEPIPEVLSGLNNGAPISEILLRISAAILCSLFILGATKIGLYIRQKKILKINPILLLPFIVIPVVALAKITMGFPNSRYAAAAVPGVLGIIILGGEWLWSLSHLMQKNNRVIINGVLVVCCALPVAVALGQTYGKLKLHNDEHAHYKVIVKMKALGLTQAEADYWTAYSTEFISDGAVRIRPSESNYKPDRYPGNDYPQILLTK